MSSSHLILCCPLFLLPPIPPSIRDFSNESTLHMSWPKYWSFSFSIIPSKEYPGLISFRMDWLDLLAVQGTPKSLLQHHSSKASILGRSAFFTVQLSHPYMTTGKTMALTRRTFVDKVMSLLLNMLSRLVITFHPRSKCLLISWFQSSKNYQWSWKQCEFTSFNMSFVVFNSWWMIVPYSSPWFTLAGWVHTILLCGHWEGYLGYKWEIGWVILQRQIFSSFIALLVRSTISAGSGSMWSVSQWKSALWTSRRCVVTEVQPDNKYNV